MAVTKAQVAQLYVALFNRAPEGAGLNAWFAAGATKTQAQLADDMLRSPAVQSYFNGRIDTDRGFVSNIYKNFLGKDYADDPAGIESWVRHLEAGHSRGETLVKLFEVAQTPEAIAAAPVAAAIFRNKTEVSAYMAEKIADIAQRDDGTYDYEPFQAIIRGTTDTNLEEQKAKVDQLASGQTPSTNKNLTAETDNIVGTDGDDTFNGVYYVGNGAKTSTLSPLDTIDGKAGKDTLNLTVQKNGSDSDSVEMSAIETAMRGVSNIENLNIRSEVKFSTSTTPPPPATIPFTVNKGLDNLSIQTIGGVNISSTDTKEKISIDTTGAVTLNAADVTKEVTVKSSAEAVTVSANKLVDKVSIEAGAGATLTAAKVQEVVIKAKGNTTIDTAKATKVTVNLNDKANTLTITSPLAEATEVTLSSLKLAAAATVAKATKISVTDVDFGTSNNISTNVENVDFSMNYKFKEGSSDAQLTAALVAANAKNLTLHAKADKKAFFTYSGATDKLVKAVIDGDAKNLTLDLHTQEALKDIDASAFTGNFAELHVKNTENSTFKLGGGDDVVKLDLDTTRTNQKTQTIDGGAGTDLLLVSKAIAVAGASSQVTIRNFEGLKVDGQLATNDVINMSNWTGFTHLTLSHSGSGDLTTGDATIENMQNGSTITIEGKKIANEVTLKVKDATTGTDDTVNLVLDPKTNTDGIQNSGNFIVENIETVNITSKADTAKTASAKNTVNLKTGADAADTLKAITVKGDIATELVLDATATKIKTVDASALEGKFTFNGTAHLDDRATIKGGTKDDTITVAGKSGASITGGAGNDTFNIGKLGDAAAFPASKVATIKDFSAGDKLYLGANIAPTPPTSIVKYEASGSLDFANNLSRALAAAGGENKLAYFTYTDPDSNSTDTYVVRADNAAGITAGDYVVKLAGTVNLDNATIANEGTNLQITI
jgi:putative surface array protein